jgi:hypothetical protein
MLSFNTGSLPDHAVITSVKLKVKSAGIVGAGLFNKSQRLEVEICKPLREVGLNLQMTDFQQQRNCIPSGTFEDKPRNGWYIANLDLIDLHINLTGITQFRLRFTKDDNDDLSADYFRFFSGNSGPTNRPTLMVRYYLP